MTTGQLNSLPFSGFAQAPIGMLAGPPYPKLDSTAKMAFEAAKVGEFTANLFPELSVQFPLSHAPLFDPALDTTGREFVERAILAPVGTGVIYSNSYPALGVALGGFVMGWVPQSNNEFADYWKTNVWKYQRSFTITKDSYWLQDAAYTTGGSPALERNDYLWELAQLGSGQVPSIVRYFTAKPKTQANGLTTQQLDVIGVDDVRVKSSDLLGYVATNVGDGFDPSAAADWCLFYDQPFVPPVVPDPPPDPPPPIFPYSTELYRVLDRQEALLSPMVDMAYQWAGMADYSSQIACVASRNDLSYRGAMYRQINSSLNPLYECTETGTGTKSRAVPAVVPFKSWAAFGDHQGLAWACVTSVPDDYAPTWRRLCKVHRTMHYLQVPWKKFEESIPAEGQTKVGRLVIETTGFSGWTTAPTALSDKMIASFIPSTMTGVPAEFVQSGTRYMAQPFPQIIGFSIAQAESQFPPVISAYNGAFVYVEKTDEATEDPKWEFSFKYLEYLVTGELNGVPFTEVRNDPEFFPWDPRGKVAGYSVQNTTIYFTLKLGSTGYTVESVRCQGTPSVRQTFANRDETYIPNNWDGDNPPECIIKFVEGIAAFYTALYQSVTDCGSYVIKDKAGTIVGQVPLYGLQQVGELKIEWQPHAVDIA